MTNKIIIFNRTDSNPAPPHLVIRSRQNSGNTDTVDKIREHLLNRDAYFSITITTPEMNQYGIEWKKLPAYLISCAYSFKKPFVNDDFDYLRNSIKSIACSIAKRTASLSVDFDIGYHTTKNQENQTESKLETIFTANGIYRIREPLLRLRFIYGFISDNVRYDLTYTKYSAYNALIEGSAVCMGCSSLFYRMVSMAGIPCRIITGTGEREPHSWNIVKIDGVWYNTDVTWDLQRFTHRYNYFLKSNGSFSRDHTPDEEFASGAFLLHYPISTADYSQ